MTTINSTFSNSSNSSVSIINCTPHQVCIYRRDQVRFDPTTRKYRKINPDSQPVRIYDPEGTIASKDWVEIPNSELSQKVGIEVSHRMPKRGTGAECKALPGFWDCYEEGGQMEYYIVSAQYKNAEQEDKVKERLLTVGPAVIDDNNKIIGCVGLYD